MKITIQENKELAALYNPQNGSLLLPFEDFDDQQNCVLKSTGVRTNGRGTIQTILQNSGSRYKPIYKGDEITIRF